MVHSLKPKEVNWSSNKNSLKAVWSFPGLIFFWLLFFFSYLAIELNSRTIFTANAQAQDSLCNKSLATHIHIYAHIKCSALTRSSDRSQKPQFSSCLHLDNLSGAHVSTNIRTQTHSSTIVNYSHNKRSPLCDGTSHCCPSKASQPPRTVPVHWEFRFSSWSHLRDTRSYSSTLHTLVFTRGHIYTYIHTNIQTYMQAYK